MKIVITEQQYILILEQRSDYAMDRQSNAILRSTGIRNQKDYNTVNTVLKKAEDSSNPLLNVDKHTAMTILQIGTAFIPLVGPFISMGIGLADAAMYYNEGDKKTAGLIAVFSMIPGVGGLAAKMGLSKWSAKALGEIGKKMSLGSKLTPIETQVVNRVAQHKQLIQTEMNKMGKQATIQSGKNAAKKQIVKSNIIKGTKKVGKFSGKQVAPYVGTGYAYDKVYDATSGKKETPSQGDITKIDTKTISPANLKASKELQF